MLRIRLTGRSSHGVSLQQAKDLAKLNMTPETVAARMSPEEAKRLKMVRNIGIAVRGLPVFADRQVSRWS